jgi:hypothetical protein
MKTAIEFSNGRVVLGFGIYLIMAAFLMQLPWPMMMLALAPLGMIIGIYAWMSRGGIERGLHRIYAWMSRGRSKHLDNDPRCEQL